MATKRQLLAQADQAGVDVDPKATKADIEEALADAGVDVDNGPGTVWFENAKTGVKFAVREGSRTHARVTDERNSHLYKSTSKPTRS